MKQLSRGLTVLGSPPLLKVCLECFLESPNYLPASFVYVSRYSRSVCVYQSFTAPRSSACWAGVHRFGPLNRMLPSQVGSAPSGNGSSSNRGTAGHCSGVVGGGVRPVLVRAVQGLPGVSSESLEVRQGDRNGNRMLGANGPGGPKGARPGNGTGLTTLQTAVQGNMVGLNAGVVLPHGARFDNERENAPLCSGSDIDSDSGDDDDPVGSLGDSRRGVKRERGEMEAAVVGQEVGVPPGGYGMVPSGVVGAKPGKKTRGRVKIKMEFIDNKLRRYTTFSKRKTGIMKKVSPVLCLWIFNLLPVINVNNVPPSLSF